MKNRVLLLFAGMVLLLVVDGCSRKGVPSTTTEVSDSVLVKEVTRFIPVVIPGETVNLTGLIECDSVTNKPKPFAGRAEGKHGALVAVTIDHSGQLNATGGFDSLKKVVEAKDKEIYRLRTEKTKTVVPVYRRTDFDTFCRWYFASTATIVIVIIFLKLKHF